MKRDPLTSIFFLLALIGLLGIVNLTLGGKKLPTPGETKEEHRHSALLPSGEESMIITPASIGVLASLTPTESFGNIHGKVVVDAFLSPSDKHQYELLRELRTLAGKYPQLLGVRLFNLDTQEGRVEMARAAVSAPGILLNGEPLAYKPIDQYTTSLVREKILTALGAR
ncbi:MAG: hypothetical protein ACPLSK_00615 [bacterium]